MDQRAVEYLRKYKEEYDLDALKQQLLNQGYSPQEVEAAERAALGGKEQHEDIPPFPDPDEYPEHPPEQPEREVKPTEPVEDDPWPAGQQDVRHPALEHGSFKERKVWLVILLSIVTVGIYFVYWFYSTYTEMNSYRQVQENVPLLTLLLFVPIANFYSLWQYSKATEAATSGKLNHIIVMLLFIILFPAGQYLVQDELNRKA